jgi:zinc/manganese transport system substrate-binding protein
MQNTRALLSLLAIPTVVLAGCQQTTQPEPLQSDSTAEGSQELAVEGPKVVVTTNILGNVVSEILTCAIGSDASMTVLMPLGADPHDFQASSSQVAAMTSADLVVANGLFLEEGLVSVLASLSSDGVPIFDVAARVDPIDYGDDAHDDHAHDDHGHDDHDDEEKDEAHEHGDFDPHFWLDMNRVATAAELIGAELGATTGESAYTDCGVSFAGEILAAEEAVISALAVIPDEKRVLVTDHDSFGYFAGRYDFRIVGVVVPGGSTLADPSSRELAALVSTIRSEGVPAIFANTAASSAVAEAVAAEVGSSVQVVPLFVGSLGGPGSGGETYIEMMTSNASLIAEALTP